MNDRFAAMRAEIEALHLDGRDDEALEKARELISQRRAGGKAALDDYLLASLCAFHLDRWVETAALLEEALTLFPEAAALHENLGVTLGRMGRPRPAISALERALELGSESANLLDSLAANHASCGRFERACVFGALSLERKNAASLGAGVRHPLEVAPPPFRGHQPTANIIAFSLWGDDSRYISGALRNADIAREIYPGWTTRFYVADSVPRSVLQKLAGLGAQLVAKPAPRRFFEALMWRFEVMDDTGVDRYLVRDTDSLVNTQERSAVDQWLESGRHFHVMRDWYTHTDLMLAGMWGGCARALPGLARLQALWRADRQPTRNADQDFLRQAVWPSVSQSCLVHDSYFDCLGSLPFPAYGRLPSGWHVGQDFSRRGPPRASACLRRGS